MKIFKILLLSLLLPLSAVSNEMTEEAIIESGKVHEVCMTLEFGKRLTYAYKSSRDLNFNIHYHVGEDVFFPVEEYASSDVNDLFTAQDDHGYCMMWTNKHDRSVKLNVIYNVR